jgi:membrane protein implicated in regulation of membrane protease activity
MRAEYWLLVGLALAIVEVLAPGIFMIFLASGAIVAATAALLIDDVRLQLVVFAAASTVAVVFGRALYRRLLHRRRDAADELGRGPVNEHGTVVDPIIGGRGKVKVRDSLWLAAGPDLPAGAPIIVARREGTLLHVAPLPSPLAGDGAAR